MSQQPPDEQQSNNRSQWGQQPLQHTQQAQWYQQPTQPTQLTGQPQNWPQQPAQQFDQSQWYQQQTQPSFQEPPWQASPIQPPGRRQTPWQRYRRSRIAQLASVLLLVLLILSLVLTFFHFTSPNPGVGPGPVTGGGTADITVDFGGRQTHTYPISSNFFGVGGLGMTNVINAAAPYLPQASLRLTRFGDFMADTFPTQASATDPAQQNWSKFDNIMSTIRDNHLQPILILSYTPSWLQPQNQNPPEPNYCLTNPKKVDASHVKPTFIENGQDIGPQKWGLLAAQVVAHMDKTFASVHPLYELWNEPDGIGYWCERYGDPGANHERLVQYEELYAAAAPIMKQQAQQDGVQIKVGGPALAFVEARATLWISSLVKDPQVAPYIDFISYHQYASAKTWDELIAKSQNPKVGYIAEYQLIASIVHSGQQPNAQSTPIYIDEYNGNSCTPQVCRNDPTYAPLWNSLFIADLLNSVAVQVSDKGLSTSVPAGSVYFTWSAPPGKFCLFGVINANYDCTASDKAQAYPQYYAYKLVGSPDYLNITDNGYAVSTVSSNKQGVIVAGFYTQKHDTILIVNTTGQAYSGLNVLAQNPGESNTTGTMFTLNKDHPQIDSKQISLQQANGGLRATVDIPPYTTLALSI